MRSLLLVVCFLSMITCARIGKVKKMVLKGKAQTGVTSKAAVATGRVSVVVPGERGWQRLVFDESSEIPNIVTTAADGTFTFSVEFNWWEEVLSVEDRPAFLAVTDSTGSYSLLAPIPTDLVEEAAEIIVNPTPETTVASLWQCPHGQFATPQPACPANVVCQASGGMPCYQLPTQSTTTDTMVNLIGIADSASSIPEPTNGGWGDYSTLLLNADPALLAKLKQNLIDKGFTVEFDFSASFVSDSIALTALPTVPVPTAADANNPPSESSGGGAETCSAFASCSSCSISACSDGENSYYKTSSGGRFNCASVSNCTLAANQVVAACCSREEFSLESEAFPFLKLPGHR